MKPSLTMYIQAETLTCFDLKAPRKLNSMWSKRYFGEINL